MFSGWFIASAQAAEGHAAESRFPPFDPQTFPSQLFWLAVLFGLLYWAMSRHALPRVGKVLADRAATISGDLDDAADMQRQARDAAAAYDQALAKAKGDAQTIAQDARAASARVGDERRKTVEGDLAAKLAASEAQIAATKAAAMANVEQIARDATAAILERLAGASPSPEAIDAALAAPAGK